MSLIEKSSEYVKLAAMNCKFVNMCCNLVWLGTEARFYLILSYSTILRILLCFSEMPIIYCYSKWVDREARG